MKKVLRIFIAFTITLSAVSVNAQHMRYLDDIFSSVTVTSDVQYAENISILPLLSGGQPTLMPLLCDIYEPSGDSLTDRPVVILAHTGIFLPPVINGQATGDKLDSSVVHQCMRWAKKGYVAVAMNYRLGWNPTSQDQDTRTSTLLQAAYRGVQDAKALVRFLNKSVAADGNPYGIDHTKIALGGHGTGSYISLAYATLDTVGDNTPWQEIYLTKFFNLTTMQPYVYPPFMGNYDGTDSAGVPILDSITGQPIGTAWMNIPNWPLYDNDISMAFNVGGALADSSWLEAGDVPMVSFHCTKDPYAPYANGDVIVPTTNDFVVECQGSYIVQKHQAINGNNAIFANAGFSDGFTTTANINNNGYDGLFPFLTPTPDTTTPNAFMEYNEEEGAPWDWWDNTWYDNMHQAIHSSPAGYGPANSMLGNPNMSAVKGNAYLDTIQGYLNPRMFLALGLDTLMTTSIEEVIDFSTEIFPNPTAGKVHVVSYAASITSIEIYNITGQIVYSKQVNANAIKINTTAFSSGTYLMNIKSDKTAISRKLIVE